MAEIWDGGDDYKGYKNTLNWSLFPLFWIPVVLLFKTTWHEFHASWKELFRNKIIISKKNTETTELYNAFLDYTKNQRNNYFSRKHLFAYSLILATVAMWLDMKELRKLYRYDNAKSVEIYPIYEKNHENKNSLKHYILSKPKEDEPETILFSKRNVNKPIIDASWTDAWIFKGD